MWITLTAGACFLLEFGLARLCYWITGIDSLVLFLVIWVLVDFFIWLFGESNKPEQTLSGERPFWLTELARKQVGYRLEVEGKSINLERNYLFAVHPHHVMSLSTMLSFIWPSKDEELVLALLKSPIPLVSDTILSIPFLGEFLKISGCRSASEVNLLIGRNESVAVNPGGTREMGSNRHGEKKLLRIIKRTGFLKGAMEKETPVVPVLVLGEEKCYRHFHSLDWLHVYSKPILDYPAPLISLGRGFSFFPKRTKKVTALVGQPLEAAPGETIEEFKQRYENSLKSMAESRGYRVDFIE